MAHGLGGFQELRVLLARSFFDSCSTPPSLCAPSSSSPPSPGS